MDLMDVNVVERPVIVSNTTRGVRFARLWVLLALHLLHGVDYNNFIVFFVWIKIFRGLLSLNPPLLLLRAVILGLGLA